jgi:Na+-translocating ferredoxin:NAD+ oxidoreductase subunit G
MSLRYIGKTAYLLTAFSLVGGILLALVNWATEVPIKRVEKETQLRNLHTVFPANLANNDLVSDTRQIQDVALLGSAQPQTAFLARHNGTPVGAVLTVIAPKGYSGPIKLLVGIRYDGTLTGVRVLAHKETPGLGDKIEPAKSPWIDQFKGLSLTHPTEDRWKVKKDGGDFDQFTGATITPRAVVTAIHNAQRYFNQHKTELFSANAGGQP